MSVIRPRTYQCAGPDLLGRTVVSFEGSYELFQTFVHLGITSFPSPFPYTGGTPSIIRARRGVRQEPPAGG